MLKSLFRRRRNRAITRYYNLMNTFDSLSPDLGESIPDAKTILTLAPHCDDESIGCGGTLYRSHQRGSKITAVFLTDGSRCDYPGTDEEKITVRKREAHEAAKILGIERLIFLDHPDQELRKTSKTVKQLINILKEVRPDAVLLPFFFDNHPDHKAVSRILAVAAEDHPDIPVYFYEVWSAMIPNFLVDISEVIEQKMEAIGVYRSQNASETIATQIRSLNQYRALMLGNDWKFAEAFFRINSHQLKTIL